jgi:hypothetical protein
MKKLENFCLRISKGKKKIKRIFLMGNRELAGVSHQRIKDIDDRKKESTFNLLMKVI